MIEYRIGNLFDSEAEALVNTINTQGVMGKGIALQFKKIFPNNYKTYRDACKSNELNIGQLLVTKENLLIGTKIIINFPTKTHWRFPSEYHYIETGLKELRKLIQEKAIKSIAIPPLGSGNGGLEWNRVKKLMEEYLGDQNCQILIYEPNDSIQEIMKKERVKLTPARAMLLSVLYELLKNGEFVSEFSAEKIAYFLQRFGGEKYFNLKFNAHFYGPYSGKVRHVLYYLNGSYVTGYSAMDKKPFEVLGLVDNGEETINNYLNSSENKELRDIVKKTKTFLSGFYSNFALELLSSVDYIIQNKQINTLEEIKTEIENWNHRKKTKFNNPKFIQIALDNINKNILNSK